jgi:hypothetical protein
VNCVQTLSQELLEPSLKVLVEGTGQDALGDLLLVRAVAAARSWTQSSVARILMAKASSLRASWMSSAGFHVLNIARHSSGYADSLT